MFKLFKKKQQQQAETRVVETENAHIEVSSDGKVEENRIVSYHIDGRVNGVFYKIK